jgi:hypothetical protein
MLARFHLKIGSLLGLLAILTATFAPSVSQTLAANRDGTALSAALCSAQSTPDDAPDSHGVSHSLASRLQACGYCNLLAHMPALPGVQSRLPLWSGQSSIALQPSSRAFGASCHSSLPAPRPASVILI